MDINFVRFVFFVVLFRVVLCCSVQSVSMSAWTAQFNSVKIIMYPHAR